MSSKIACTFRRGRGGRDKRDWDHTWSKTCITCHLVTLFIFIKQALMCRSHTAEHDTWVKTVSNYFRNWYVMLNWGTNVYGSTVLIQNNSNLHLFFQSTVPKCFTISKTINQKAFWSSMLSRVISTSSWWVTLVEICCHIWYMGWNTDVTGRLACQLYSTGLHTTKLPFNAVRGSLAFTQPHISKHCSSRWYVAVALWKRWVYLMSVLILNHSKAWQPSWQ